MSDCNQSQTQAMRAFLDREHFRYVADPAATARADEVRLPAGAATLAAPESPLSRAMRDDYQRFCQAWLGDVLATSWTLTADRPSPADRLDPEGEAFELTIRPEGIAITAAYERGLLHGTHYLERLLADRGGPFLQVGSIRRQPCFMPRISNGVFIDAKQDIGDASGFTNEYLSLMSHFGVNGIHLHTHLSDIWQSESIPELNASEANETLSRLSTFVQRAKRYGIDLYLYLALAPLPGDHAAFRVDPRRRGARTVMGDLHRMHDYHCLCVGCDDVLSAYEEVITHTFEQVPGLGGAIVITGGEGLVHCYTRPAQPYDGFSSCPHCQETPPAGPIGRLVNRLGSAVKAVDSRHLLFAWPYSAFTWSGDDRAQVSWIGTLGPDVELLANFATGSTDETTGGGVVLYDYNIKTIGPSAIFREQARTAHDLGRRIFARSETCTNPDAFFLPYIPVHHRWHGRGRALAEIGAHGFVGQWRFYGMNGSPPEELQYQATWNPERPVHDLLMTMARRDFGLIDSYAEKVVAAWRLLSDAWDDYPYSAMTAGERAFYMRGPFYLGPAHPLIFNPQKRYRLGADFFLLRGDIRELAEGEELAALARQAPPRYISDLMVVMPFGVQRYLELLRACREKWSEGLGLLKRVLGPAPNKRARMELDVVETLDIHLATLANVVEFYRLRDQLTQMPLEVNAFKGQLRKLHGLVRREMANAQRILPILERDPRIGYGHCYGVVYTADMVKEKLAQAEYVLQEELPAFSAGVRFHLWNDFS